MNDVETDYCQERMIKLPRVPARVSLSQMGILLAFLWSLGGDCIMLGDHASQSSRSVQRGPLWVASKVRSRAGGAR